MDGENNGKPYFKWMIWGFSHIFGSTPIWRFLLPLTCKPYNLSLLRSTFRTTNPSRRHLHPAVSSHPRSPFGTAAKTTHGPSPSLWPKKKNGWKTVVRPRETGGFRIFLGAGFGECFQLQKLKKLVNLMQVFYWNFITWIPGNFHQTKIYRVIPCLPASIFPSPIRLEEVPNKFLLHGDDMNAMVERVRVKQINWKTVNQKKSVKKYQCSPYRSDFLKAFNQIM